MLRTRTKAALLISLFTLLAISYYLLCVGVELRANQYFVRTAIIITLGFVGLVYVLLDRHRLLRNILLIITGMSSFAFALVPLYNVFCDVTGLNGKIDLSVVAATPDGVIDDREVLVEFDVSYNQQMPWQFKPQRKQITVKPGELVRTAYWAKNPTNKTMVAQAIPSITPFRASRHFKKVECFCFSSQKLGPSQSAHLGLQFYLDPNLPKDVSRLTLSYTLFDITKEALLEEKEERQYG